MLFVGVGLKDDVVTVRPNFGRTELLLPGLAVYASPENLEKLEKSKENAENTGEKEKNAPLQHSSRFAELVTQIFIHLLTVLDSRVCRFFCYRLDGNYKEEF